MSNMAGPTTSWEARIGGPRGTPPSPRESNNDYETREAKAVRSAGRGSMTEKENDFFWDVVVLLLLSLCHDSVAPRTGSCYVVVAYRKPHERAVSNRGDRLGAKQIPLQYLREHAECIWSPGT